MTKKDVKAKVKSQMLKTEKSGQRNSADDTPLLDCGIAVVSKQKIAWVRP